MLDFMILWLFLSIYVVIAQYPYQCVNDSTIVYADNGVISFTQTLITCLKNINDPLVFPGYYFPMPPVNPLYVQAQIALNNLIDVDEIHSTATLDFFFRLYWTDPRLNMTALWDKLPSALALSGVDLSQILGVTDVLQGDQPGIWMPDIYFPDAETITVTNFLLRLHPQGYMEWSRLVTVTLDESSFEYATYPQDTQNIIIRFSSYGLNSTYLQILPYYSGGYVVLFKDYAGEYSFSKSPLWTYLSSFGETEAENNGPGRSRSTGVVYVSIQRRSVGLILRLIFPIFLLAILGGLVFWSPRSERSAAAVSLLLAISALYIIIFQNIPMLGYLTVMDKFVLFIFTIIFSSSVVHNIVERFGKKEKIEQWPLRKFYVKFIEFLGKISIVPVTVLLFFIVFSGDFGEQLQPIGITAGAMFLALVLSRELVSIRSHYKMAIERIKDKINDNNMTAPEEILLFNWHYYNVFHIHLDYHYRMKSDEEKLRRKEKQPSVLGGVNFGPSEGIESSNLEDKAND